MFGVTVSTEIETAGRGGKSFPNFLFSFCLSPTENEDHGHFFKKALPTDKQVDR